MNSNCCFFLFSLIIYNAAADVAVHFFNNPQMHIWHHAYDIPKERKYGVNFGLTLSLWDYLFGTDYIPREGKNIKLGFRGIERFPKTFITQNLYGVNNPNLQLLSLLKRSHVKIMVCGQSLEKKFGADTVNEHVEVALSAMTVLAEYQQNGFSVLYI